MNPPRLMFASVSALFRVTGAVLQSAPTLMTVNHLFVAPFGPQLEHDLDGAASGWPGASFPSKQQALADDAANLEARRFEPRG
jgi:hypothetical protein